MNAYIKEKNNSREQVIVYTINDTNLHAPLKTTNQELGKSLMIDQLRTNPKEILQPTWDDIMRILEEIFKSSEIDVLNHFKALWVTNALDGSEDCLVSERLMSLVGENIKVFHDQLKKKKVKKNWWASQTDWTTSPIDKGFERFEGFDCDGEQLQNEEVNLEAESDNLNLMAKAAIMKIEKQQILLVLMKKSNKQLLKHLKSL